MPKCSELWPHHYLFILGTEFNVKNSVFFAVLRQKIANNVKNYIGSYSAEFSMQVNDQCQ